MNEKQKLYKVLRIFLYVIIALLLFKYVLALICFIIAFLFF